mmetsp:Transcript_20861/g.43544  ORF Transcript_20861/g.43544 Transcript_20861/m.43544 type:complete len:206 (+) Transcript_20861:531-1148(+)
MASSSNSLSTSSMRSSLAPSCFNSFIFFLFFSSNLSLSLLCDFFLSSLSLPTSAFVASVCFSMILFLFSSSPSPSSSPQPQSAAVKPFEKVFSSSLSSSDVRVRVPPAVLRTLHTPRSTPPSMYSSSFHSSFKNFISCTSSSPKTLSTSLCVIPLSIILAIFFFRLLASFSLRASSCLLFSSSRASPCFDTSLSWAALSAAAADS